MFNLIAEYVADSASNAYFTDCKNKNVLNLIYNITVESVHNTTCTQWIQVVRVVMLVLAVCILYK